MTPFIQLDEGTRTTSLRPVATLSLEPADFTARYGMEFTEAPSNLGQSVGAFVETEPGRQYALMRYLESPLAGTEVLASEHDDPAHAVARFLAAFGLDDRVVTWTLAADRPAQASR